MKIKISDIIDLTTVHDLRSKVNSDYKFDGCGSFDRSGYFRRRFNINDLNEEVDGEKLFEWGCKNGQIKLVTSLCETNELLLNNNNYNKTVVIAAKNNHVSTFIYLCENNKIPHKYIIESVRWSCLKGHLDIVKYIIENDKYNIQKQQIVGTKNFLLTMICEKGCTPTLKYLFKKFEFIVNDFDDFFHKLKDDDVKMLIINNLDLY
jgi:ankyrin repeat protein